MYMTFDSRCPKSGETDEKGIMHNSLECYECGTSTYSCVFGEEWMIAAGRVKMTESGRFLVFYISADESDMKDKADFYLIWDRSIGMVLTAKNGAVYAYEADWVQGDEELSWYGSDETDIADRILDPDRIVTDEDIAEILGDIHMDRHFYDEDMQIAPYVGKMREASRTNTN